jgi:hypothetical protein
LPSLKDETICDALPPHLLKVPTGIVGTAIDADTHALTIDYDPRLISDESVRQVAERLAATLRQMHNASRRTRLRSVCGPHPRRPEKLFERKGAK